MHPNGFGRPNKLTLALIKPSETVSREGTFGLLVADRKSSSSEQAAGSRESRATDRDGRNSKKHATLLALTDKIDTGMRYCKRRIGVIEAAKAISSRK